MKYITFVLCLFLIASCAHVPETSSPVNVDGTWSGVYDSKGRDGQPPKLFILKLKGDGETLTGTGCDATSRPGEWMELKNAKIKGNELTFTAKPMPGMTVRGVGKVEGDILNMTFKYNTPGGVFSDSFTLEREK